MYMYNVYVCTYIENSIFTFLTVLNYLPYLHSKDFTWE